MNELIFLALITLLTLIGSAFFSMAETAITCASRAKLHKLKLEGNKKAKIISKLIKNRDTLISAILFCNSAANVFASAFATNFAILLFGEQGIIWSSIIMSIIIFLVAEVLPKTIALEKADRISLEIASTITWLVKLCYPVTRITRTLSKIVKSLLGHKVALTASAEEELRGAIALHFSEGSMLKDDLYMLSSILDLANTEVANIMVHRKNMITFNIDLPIEELITNILATPYTRIPFWQTNPDNIIGILHIRDLLGKMAESKGEISKIDVNALLSKPWFIPDTTLLSEQLEEFRRRRRHFAIVIDEYGSIMGLVTLEDVIEAIVGDIKDEHDHKNTEIVPNLDGSYNIGGQVNIRSINRTLDWSLPVENASTIAGLIMHQIQKIPEEGEIFIFHSIEFQILSKKDNRIHLIKASKIHEPPEGNERDRDNNYDGNTNEETSSMKFISK